MNKKAMMSYSQILILVLAMFAFSYMIYSFDNDNIVSAQDTETTICCAETISGNTCQDVKEAQCKEGSQKSPNECKDTQFCQPGCCVSDETGLCNVVTPKKDCDAIGGKWSDNLACNIQECFKKCCILGTQGIWTTEKNCEIESSFLRIPIEFRTDVQGEGECIYVTEKDDEGACVFESGDETTCVFTTREECVKRIGSEDNFYKDTYCSNEELGTNCEAHIADNCLDNKEEVYWFDSCGNREEIKQGCSIFTGTICGVYRPSIDEEPQEGEYVCRDLSCDVDVQGEQRHYKNGESWCEYEGLIGDGRDVVGSRHVRKICYMGEEKIEPCSDYRNQVCVGTNKEFVNGDDFSEAVCRVNHWRSCYQYNGEQEGMAEKCEQNPDCKIQGVHIDKFGFDVCVPNYPPGFDLKTESSRGGGEDECSFGSQECTVIYVKRVSGWKCQTNCACEKPGFTQQMNDLCINLGDCGGYVNWVGEYTDDGYTSGAGRIDGNQYKKNAVNDPNQEPAEPGPFGFSQILGMPIGLGGEEIVDEQGLAGMLGGAIGAINMMEGMTGMISTIPILGDVGIKIGTTFLPELGELFGATKESVVIGYEQVEFGEQLISEGQTLIEAGNTELGNQLVSGGEEMIAQGTGDVAVGGEAGTEVASEAFGNFMAGVGAGLSVASFLQAGFGLDAGTSYAVGGGVAIVVWMNPALWWIGLALTIAQFIFGWGKTKEKIIKFDCYPWQAPAGGNNCDKCNSEDVLCSEYKCESLGQTCEFINQGTSNEKCIENDPYDVSSPKITPNLEAIDEGYEYRNINFGGFEIKTDQGGCVDEYNIINYGIETDRPAQCKIGVSPLETYDQMPEYFGGKNAYLTNHTNVIFMPSPAAFKNQYNLTDEQVEALGNIKFYVKCKSINGAKNVAPFVIDSCVKPGPDLTAPRITNTIPSNGGFAKFGATEQDLKLWTNEPSQCKWSKEDKDFEEMETQMNCQSDLEDYGLYGWECNTTITGLSGNSSEFYFRCKDQPWELDESLRNTNSESYEYSLSVSNTPLTIKDFKPADDDKIVEGVEPVNFDLRVETAGGAENGKAICNWEGNGYSDEFTETNSNFHSYTITSGTRGDYNMKFICEDVAGNVAEDETSFEIQIDTSGPRIIRTYYDGGLKIVTLEESECRYDFERNFIWENATQMSGNGFNHVGDWQLKTYYVQCEDNFGNKGGKKRIKAYDLM